MALQKYREAIARIESGGRYNAIGPRNPKMGRALGRYQIMESNIGPWSREALGREVSPDEFLANPQLQDTIFDHKFGGYVQKFGPEGAAQAWFGGPGGVGKTNRKDVLGTSIGKYGNMFMEGIGGQAPAPDTGTASPPLGVAPGGTQQTPFSMPPEVAQYATSGEPKTLGNRLSDAAKWLEADKPPAAPRIASMGGAGNTGNALAKVMENPTSVADALLKRRMPFAFS